jgi:hypothetical protein
MTRTKWMRLVVRDPGDVLRWASQQDARQLDAFRYRVIAGREFVSFRLVPRYPIQIGTSDIIVVAHSTGTALHRLAAALRGAARRTVRRMARATTWLTAPRPSQALRSADLYRLPTAQRSSTSQRY